MKNKSTEVIMGNSIFFKLFKCFSMVFFMCNQASAQIKVITSTSTLANLVQELGGPEVQVQSLSRGTEDPHYIEAKPSFMVRARDADLAIVVGLELEKAWMNNVLAGSRNPKVLPGAPGFLDLGESIPALEKISGSLDRSQGDVHPLGNPHYYLDPVRVKDALPQITQKLIALMPTKKAALENRLKNYTAELDKKINEWQMRLQKAKGKSVVTYHKTLLYFIDRFQLTLKNTIEPKPGIPPTASHTLELIKQARTENIRCFLNEAHFETVAAQRIAKEVRGNVSVVPTEVGALPGTETYIHLIDKIVAGVEACP